jgi:hypothetical protein
MREHKPKVYILLKKEKRGRRDLPYRRDVNIYAAYYVAMVT